MHFNTQIAELRKQRGIGRERKWFGQIDRALHGAVESRESAAPAQFHIEDITARQQRDVEFQRRDFRADQGASRYSFLSWQESGPCTRLFRSPGETVPPPGPEACPLASCSR